MNEWSDVDNTLKIDPRGNVVIKRGKDALKQSLINILSTMQGERVRSTLGGSLLPFLFEPITDDTAESIQLSIRDSIERFDLRIEIKTVRVREDVDNNGYWVTIRYRPDLSITNEEITTFLNAMVD